MDLHNTPRLLTVDEAREILRVGRNTMFAQCKEPGFPVIKIGKQLRIPLPSLLKWIDDRAS